VDRDLPAGLVCPADRGGELPRIPVDGVAPTVVEVDLQPLDAEVVIDRTWLARGVPVAEELAVVIQGEVGVDPERQGGVRG